MLTDAKFGNAIRVTKKYTDICKNRHYTNAKCHFMFRNLFDFLINADKFLRFPLPVQYKILPLPYLQGPEKAGIL